MDITLIPVSEIKYDKKHRKSFLTDAGMVQLTDCSLVLLHKSGMRPLYLMHTKEEVLREPEHKIMAQPDLIVCCNSSAGKQSARVIQEQLERCSCHTRILTTDFSVIKKSTPPDHLKNLLSTRASHLEQRGFHHIVVVADKKYLNQIALCINGKGLNPEHNIPIYSFSNGQEIEDKNLVENLYITREILDYLLINELNKNGSDKWNGKCNYPIAPYQLRRKLHFPEERI